MQKLVKLSLCLTNFIKHYWYQKYNDLNPFNLFWIKGGSFMTRYLLWRHTPNCFSIDKVKRKGSTCEITHLAFFSKILLFWSSFIADVNSCCARVGTGTHPIHKAHVPICSFTLIIKPCIPVELPNVCPDFLEFPSSYWWLKLFLFLNIFSW